jgi:hypothetical protein
MFDIVLDAFVLLANDRFPALLLNIIKIRGSQQTATVNFNLPTHLQKRLQTAPQAPSQTIPAQSRHLHLVR